MRICTCSVSPLESSHECNLHHSRSAACDAEQGGLRSELREITRGRRLLDGTEGGEGGMLDVEPLSLMGDPGKSD